MSPYPVGSGCVGSCCGQDWWSAREAAPRSEAVDPAGSLSRGVLLCRGCAGPTLASIRPPVSRLTNVPWGVMRSPDRCLSDRARRDQQLSLTEVLTSTKGGGTMQAGMTLRFQRPMFTWQTGCHSAVEEP